MCDKTVNALLPTSRFVLDWFVTKKMLEKLYGVIFSVLMIWTLML